MNAPARRGRPPRIRPEIKPNILADQARSTAEASEAARLASGMGSEDIMTRQTLSDYSENLARAAAAIMADEPAGEGWGGDIRPEPPVEQIRPSMRPEMREEDPRARAARRAAELRDMGGLDDGSDEFHIPDSDVPPGWSYEWKRHTTFNAEDPSYWGQVLRHGWEPVPASRHQHMVAGGGNQKVIDRKGMVLMERPLEITQEMRRKADKDARNQVRAKELEATGKPLESFDRDNPQLAQKINRTYERPVPIPD